MRLPSRTGYETEIKARLATAPPSVLTVATGIPADAGNPPGATTPCLQPSELEENRSWAAYEDYLRLAWNLDLGKAKEYLEGMVENSADIIITVNPEGLIETFNRGGEEAAGLRPRGGDRQAASRCCMSIRARGTAIAHLRTTGSVKNYETRLQAKDGHVRNVLLTLSHLRDADGKPIGTIGISKDVTQEKKLQDELRDAKEYLEGMVENSADIIITVNSGGVDRDVQSRWGGGVGLPPRGGDRQTDREPVCRSARAARRGRPPRGDRQRQELRDPAAWPKTAESGTCC